MDYLPFWTNVSKEAIKYGIISSTGVAPKILLSTYKPVGTIHLSRYVFGIIFLGTAELFGICQSAHHSPRLCSSCRKKNITYFVHVCVQLIAIDSLFEWFAWHISALVDLIRLRIRPEVLIRNERAVKAKSVRAKNQERMWHFKLSCLVSVCPCDPTFPGYHSVRLLDFDWGSRVPCPVKGQHYKISPVQKWLKEWVTVTLSAQFLLLYLDWLVFPYWDKLDQKFHFYLSWTNTWAKQLSPINSVFGAEFDRPLELACE